MVTAGSRTRRRDEEERIILSSELSSPSRPRQILARRMSGFVTNMFQYDVTVGITRSEVIFWPNSLPSRGSWPIFECLKGQSFRQAPRRNSNASICVSEPLAPSEASDFQLKLPVKLRISAMSCSFSKEMSQLSSMISQFGTNK